MTTTRPRHAEPCPTVPTASVATGLPAAGAWA